MKLSKFKVVNTNFINTSEAYSKIIFVGNGNVAIPYINIGLMQRNPINKKQSVVDYSYYVFIGVQSMNFSAMKGKLTIDFDVDLATNSITEYIMAGGFNSDNGAEVKIICNDLIFYLPDGAGINDPFHPYLPFDTPNFKQNIDTKYVEAFFLTQNLPEEIKEILGGNIFSLIWW